VADRRNHWPLHTGSVTAAARSTHQHAHPGATAPTLLRTARFMVLLLLQRVIIYL